LSPISTPQITEEEFFQVSCQAGVPRPEIQSNWRKFKQDAETDEDGVVSRSEFLQYWRGAIREGRSSLDDLAARADKLSADLKEARRRELTRMLTRWFSLFDRNGDGVIDEEEYLAALEVQMRSKFFFAKGESHRHADLALEWKTFVAGADQDQDGKVNADEFVAFWKADIAEGKHVVEEVAGLCAQLAKDLRMEAITDRGGGRDFGAPPGSPESPHRRSGEVPALNTWLDDEVDGVLRAWFTALDDNDDGELAEEEYMEALDGDGKEDALYLRQSWVDLTAEMLSSGHGVVTVELFVAFWRQSISQMFLAMPKTEQGWRCARDILAICKENKDSAERPFWVPSFFRVPSLPKDFPKFSLNFGSDDEEDRD